MKTLHLRTVRPGSIIIMAWMLSAFGAQESVPVLYRIDAARSRIEVTVFAGGLLKIMGHNHAITAKSFSGEVRFNPVNMANSSVDLSIESSSLLVLDDPGLSEKDRKQVQADMDGDKVLNVQQFPQIAFHSTGMSGAGKTGEDFTLRGKLDLHGLKTEMAFPVHIHRENNFLHVTGMAVIAQTDFGIKPIKAAAGGLRVKDQVHVSFDIFAERAN